MHTEGEALIESGLVTDGHSLFHDFKALFDKFLAARFLEIIELFKGGRLGFLDGRESGPFKQKGGGQRTPKVLTAQLQSLRKIGFEQCLETIGQSGAFIDHRATMSDQLLEQAGLTVLGSPRFEFVAVMEE